MDKDRIEGSLEQAKGKVKETTGNLSGDAHTEIEGKAEQVKGRAQAEVGDAKEKVKRAIDKA